MFGSLNNTNYVIRLQKRVKRNFFELSGNKADVEIKREIQIMPAYEISHECFC